MKSIETLKIYARQIGEHLMSFEKPQCKILLVQQLFELDEERRGIEHMINETSKSLSAFTDLEALYQHLKPVFHKMTNLCTFNETQLDTESYDLLVSMRIRSNDETLIALEAMINK